MNWRRDIVPPVALIAILIFGWYFVAEISGMSSFILPTPLDVIRAGWETRDLLLNAIGTTLLATGIGLVLALFAGVGIPDTGNRTDPHHLVWIWRNTHDSNSDLVLFLPAGNQYRRRADIFEPGVDSIAPRYGGK